MSKLCGRERTSPAVTSMTTADRFGAWRSAESQRSRGQLQPKTQQRQGNPDQEVTERKDSIEREGQNEQNGRQQVISRQKGRRRPGQSVPSGRRRNSITLASCYDGLVHHREPGLLLSTDSATNQVEPTLCQKEQDERRDPIEPQGLPCAASPSVSANLARVPKALIAFLGGISSFHKRADIPSSPIVSSVGSDPSNLPGVQ